MDNIRPLLCRRLLGVSDPDSGETITNTPPKAPSTPLRRALPWRAAASTGRSHRAAHARTALHPPPCWRASIANCRVLFATPWPRERSETISPDPAALEDGNAFSLEQRLRSFDGTSSGQGLRTSHIPHRSNYNRTAGADIERHDSTVATVAAGPSGRHPNGVRTPADIAARRFPPMGKPKDQGQRFSV